MILMTKNEICAKIMTALILQNGNSNEFRHAVSTTSAVFCLETKTNGLFLLHSIL